MGDEDESLDVGALETHADGQTYLRVYSYDTEQRHAKHFCTMRTVVNESDVLHRGEPRP